MFSCNSVPLSTLQFPGCEEVVKVVAEEQWLLNPQINFKSIFQLLGGPEEVLGTASRFQWQSQW